MSLLSGSVVGSHVAWLEAAHASTARSAGSVPSPTLRFMGAPPGREHRPGAGAASEDRVRLLRRAAHIGAVARRPGTVAVGGDRRPGVRDVALVRVGG